MKKTGSTLFKDAYKERPIDCITVGRANVDMYPMEGEGLDEARVYNVFVGGSPANIAAGISRLGLKAGIITRVAKDKHGEFVANYLANNFGIDTSAIQYDESGALTSLAFAECRSDATTIMYRNNVADLRLDPSEIDKEYLSQSKSVFISGTALTEQPSRDAVMKILEYAQELDIVSAIDIDYRPYGWNSLDEAAEVISKAASLCQLIIGTREEFEVAGASSATSDEQCADYFFEQEAKLIVVKRGADGSVCFFKNDTEIQKIPGYIFPVKEKKPYGAGDAFASCLISYLIKGRALPEAMKAAAASASINIMGDSCTEAMAQEEEINAFLEARAKE